jgi:hypothetical protein
MLAAGGQHAEQAIHDLTIIAAVQGQIKAVKELAKTSEDKLSELKSYIRKLENGG